MATETETEVIENNPDETAEGTEESAVKKPGLLASKKVKVIGLVMIVMFVEAIGMYFLLPAPSVADDAQGELAATEEGADGEEGDIEMKEVEIGAFKTTNTIAAPGSIIHVSFTAIAMVSAENEDSFNTAVKEQYNWRVKQAVSKVIRSSSLEDLNAPSQGTISRLIREEINKVLSKSYVMRVVLEPYTMMEQ